MAQREQRGNREVKKPKKDKPKTPVAQASAFASTVKGSTLASGGGKKK
jgi:hypothetical protein